MKVTFNFDTGARRIRLRAEDTLEEALLKDMAELCTKGVNMKISNIVTPIANTQMALNEYEIEMRIQ